MPSISHPGRLLKRELSARKLSANRLSLDIGVPSGRITDILNARRSISADTAVRFGRYFGNGAQFWLDLQSQYDIAVVACDHGREIARRVRPRGCGGSPMARPAVHPGEILADELEELAVSPTGLARQIRVPANRITQIVQGKRGDRRHGAAPGALVRNECAVLAQSANRA